MTIFRSALRIALPLAAALACMVAPLQGAVAATSPWAVNEGGRMRLVALPPDEAGKVRAGLQIEPAPGWITYWREPGNSGIPPQISLSPESGFSLDSMSYPVPRHIVDGSVNDFGYDGPVTFPLSLSVSKSPAPATIEATAFIGLCKNICIPFQAELSLTLPSAGQTEPEEEAILQAATASLPEAPSDSFKVLAHSLSADGKRLSLRLALPQGNAARPEIFVTGPSGYVFWKQEGDKRGDDAYETTVGIGKLPKNYDIKGKTWDVLVIDGRRAMQTTLVFD